MKRHIWLFLAAAVGILVCGAGPTPVRADDSVTVTVQGDATRTLKMKDLGTIHYSILYNRTFTYWDLFIAKWMHYDENTQASILKVAEEANIRFDTVYAQVQDGVTFSMLADEYDLDLDGIYHNDRQKAEIEEFWAAWYSSGRYGMFVSLSDAAFEADVAEWNRLYAAYPEIPQRAVLTFAPGPPPPAPQPAVVAQVPPTAPVQTVEQTPPSPAPRTAVMNMVQTHHGRWVCTCGHHRTVRHYRATRHVRRYHAKYVRHHQKCHCHWVES